MRPPSRWNTPPALAVADAKPIPVPVKPTPEQAVAEILAVLELFHVALGRESRSVFRLVVVPGTYRVSQSATSGTNFRTLARSGLDADGMAVLD